MTEVTRKPDPGLAAQWAVLDALPSAALVIDGSLAVAFANSASWQLFRERGELRCAGNILSARRMDDQILLQAATSLVLATGDPRLVTFRSRQGYPVMAITLRSLGSLRLLAMPVALRLAEPASEQTLMELLQLTPAQARLARRLASGDSLTEAAAQTGVAISTVRWTLRALLAKSGARNQVMLMDLLSRAAQFGCLMAIISIS